MTHSAFYLCWWNGKRFQQIVKFKKVKSPWWQFLLQRKNLILYWQIFSLSLCKKNLSISKSFFCILKGISRWCFCFQLEKISVPQLEFSFGWTLHIQRSKDGHSFCSQKKWSWSGLAVLSELSYVYHRMHQMSPEIAKILQT